MHVRKADLHELDTIYTMGFDVWGDGLTLDDYLTGCRKSEKYLSGTWYVLIEKDRVVSSLIVYSDMFGLAKGCSVLALWLRLKNYDTKAMRLN